MSDFLGNPAEYMERARHTAVLVENAGETPLTISSGRKGLLAIVSDFFKPKPRQLGALRGQMKLTWVGDGKITPEELFTDRMLVAIALGRGGTLLSRDTKLPQYDGVGLLHFW